MSRADDLVRAALALAGLGAPRRVVQMGHGMSGDLVFRIEAGASVFVKLGGAQLRWEVEALRWLDRRAGAPRLVWSGEVEGRPAMVSAALEGVALHQLAPETAAAGAAAGLAALARLHALPTGDCPFDMRLAVTLAEAEIRLANGEIDPADFDRDRRGRTPQSAWAELLARRPGDEDLVVAHGDASWPNFILKADGEAGIVDLGRFGVSDRYRDLALFVRSARHNFPALPILELLAQHYPLCGIDADKLEFYRLLDEFF